MMITLRFDETHIPIRADLTPWLTAYGFVVGDRTDALWMVKGNDRELDSEALYTGTEANQGLIFDGNTALLYLLDFTALSPGQTYRFGLGLKYPGDPRFREVRLGDADLFVEQDFIRG